MSYGSGRQVDGGWCEAERAARGVTSGGWGSGEEVGRRRVCRAGVKFSAE